MKELVQIFRILFNIFILIGTAYLVGWHNWNAWWFLFDLVILHQGPWLSVKTKQS